MKHIWKTFSVALLVATIGFTACNDEEDTAGTTKTEAENKNDSALDTKAAERNAEFVVDVVASNIGEVKLAQLAQQKSSNAEIKDVAKMLESDHSAVLTDLRSLANKKGITVPSEEAAAAKDKAKELSEEKAAEFDKEWCETLMDNHKNSISKFENAAKDLTDPDLQSFVNAVLPKLRTHHDKLMECHKKLK